MYQVYLIDDEPWVLIGLERLISWENMDFVWLENQHLAERRGDKL